MEDDMYHSSILLFFHFLNAQYAQIIVIAVLACFCIIVTTFCIILTAFLRL